MMKLDEAIKHAEEVAEENEKFCYKKGGKGGYFNEDTDWDNVKCAAEHRQLEEWLKELKMLREQKRPHGEWKKTGRTNIYGGFEIECSVCHTTLMVSPNRWKIGENFCDVCGSDNRKEGEKNENT